jgi:hypothetical protein
MKIGMKPTDYKVDDDGYILDSEGISYETLEDYIQTGLFGFCGCGMPDANLEYIRGALQLLADRRLMWDDPSWGKGGAQQWLKSCKDYFESNKAEYFMWYVLDGNGLIEHGSSVPGWLTCEGEELLELMNEMVNDANHRK